MTHVADLSAADKRLRAQHLLWKRYRQNKNKQIARLCSTDINGPALLQFRKQLRRFKITEADQLVDYVFAQAQGWLRGASLEIRQAAMEQVGFRIMRIRERNGLPPFDDPVELPGETGETETNVYRLCKQALGF